MFFKGGEIINFCWLQSRKSGSALTTGTIRYRVLYLLFMLVFFLTACRPVTSETSPIIISASELEAFADSFFSSRMAEYHIPGVVFVFVQDRQVILAKGYGYANLSYIIVIF